MTEQYVAPVPPRARPFARSLAGSIEPEAYRSLTTAEQYVLKHPDWGQTKHGRWLKGRLERDPGYMRDAKARRQASRIASGEGYHTARWEARLRGVFGISPETYEAMLAAQGGLCAVCRKPESATRRRMMPNGLAVVRVKRLAVDHDHQTGRIRGLLCQRCNTLIGSAGDDPVVLGRAIQYLGDR